MNRRLSMIKSITQGSFQSFWWGSHNRKRRAGFPSSTKSSRGCFSLGHNSGVIVKECTGRRRLARKCSPLSKQTLRVIGIQDLWRVWNVSHEEYYKVLLVFLPAIFLRRVMNRVAFFQSTGICRFFIWFALASPNYTILENNNNNKKKVQQ